jgi:arginyl-tRNA synthetase
MKETIEQLVKTALKNLGLPEVSFAIEHPDDVAHGDYAVNVAMVLAKQAKLNPRECATKIVSELERTLPSTISKVEIAGPGFINLYLSSRYFVDAVSEVLKGGKGYGKNMQFSKDVWAIEYASPNPNKSMHLGHMRNAITGIALCNILEANGARVIREMVDNNRGIAIAKLMWGYLVAAKKDGVRVGNASYWQSHKSEWHTPESRVLKADRFVDELYVKGAAECENSENEKKVRQLVVDWEAGDKVVWDLWETVLKYAHDGQAETLSRLGARFDYVWHEHEHYEKGKQYVESGLEKGIFKKLPDGAVLTDLSQFKLTDTVVQKQDGTSLYITQDIALTDLKKIKHNANHLVWVIGPEQSLALQQLFAVCEQLGIGKREEFTHIAYGYVSIKGQGKMSSRAGNVVYVDDLFDEAKTKVESIVKERIGEGDPSLIAEAVAHSAVTYEILKVARQKDIAFDMEMALSFEGDSGPYLLYSAVRAKSILDKAEKAGIKASLEKVDADIAMVERMVARYGEVVARAGVEMAPHQIALYLIELSSAFNSWYGNTKIVDAEDVHSPWRVAVTASVRIVLENGLALLGMKVPERM